MSLYIDHRKEVIQTLYGIALRLTREMYLESLLIVAKLILLPKGIDSFTKIVHYLKDAPKHILIQYGLEKVEQSIKQSA